MSQVLTYNTSSQIYSGDPLSTDLLAEMRMWVLSRNPRGRIPPQQPGLEPRAHTHMQDVPHVDHGQVVLFGSILQGAIQGLVQFDITGQGALFFQASPFSFPFGCLPPPLPPLDILPILSF